MAPPRGGGRKGPQLPFAMRERLGMPEPSRRKQRNMTDRDDGRKDDRQSKKAQTADSRRKFRKVESTIRDEEDDDEQINGFESSSEESGKVVKPTKPKSAMKALSIPASKSQLREPASSSNSEGEDPEVDEILISVDDDDSDDDSLSRGSREYSPEVVLDASSRNYRTKQAEEDDEILTLEKKLGKKKGAKVFDDGFDDLLGELDEVVEPKKRKREEQDWLQQKRQKAQSKSAAETESEENDSDNEDGSLDSANSDQEADDFEGFDEEDEEDEEESDHAAVQVSTTQRVRENPYIAPVETNGNAQKYVPPSRRKPPEGESADLTKLRRQTQGLLNKLSESNMISIVDEFEKLYNSNPRQDMHQILTEALLGAFAIQSSLNNTFIILHAAFVAALYKILGADFGAEVLTRIVEAFDGHHRDRSNGKEAINLISLLSNLFTFGVISSTLVYDHIRLLLSEFGENSAELLLRILRDCGPQLRQSDPTSLKEIVQMMNEVSAAMTSNGQPINIRTRVMMDTITDLKNNKVRQASNAAGVTGEHLTRMRKALGGLSTRQLRATEPLGIGRNDILNSEKKGKWWLVGASWKGRDSESVIQTIREREADKKQKQPDDDNMDYSRLFSQYKLTSPVHRSIFVALTSATDARDALQRLQKLRLTRKQEIEIPAVILRTCRAETHFNVYYGALSKMLLREKRYLMPFNIALWKFFSALGEKQSNEEVSDDEDEESDVQISEIGIVAQLYAYLITKGSLTLDILKTLGIGMTKERASLFLELFFITLFNQKHSDSKLYEIFATGLDISRTKALSYFIKKHVRRTSLVEDTKQKNLVKNNADLAIAALTAQQRGSIID